MGVPSLYDLAVDGTLNTTNQPTNIGSFQPKNVYIAINAKNDVSWHMMHPNTVYLIPHLHGAKIIDRNLDCKLVCDLDRDPEDVRVCT